MSLDQSGSATAVAPLKRLPYIYSRRRAVRGFSAEARRAGSTHATAATAPSSDGRPGETHRVRARNAGQLPRDQAPGAEGERQPAADPGRRQHESVAQHQPDHLRRGPAPSAMRRPISRVRCAALNAITP